MTYWVIQVVGNTFYTYPYRTIEAAKARFEKVKGGEVFLHQSYNDDPKTVVDEFKAAKAAGRV